MSTRPDVIERNKSKSQRQALSLFWSDEKNKKRVGAKISSAMKGNTNGTFRAGIKHTQASKDAMSKNMKGRVPWNRGTGDPEKIRDAIRHSKEYIEWRMAVFQLDGFMCVIGGKEHGNKLQADHIKPFAHFPELRFDINNGRTLCVECHYKTDTYGHKAKSYKLQLP